MVNQFLPASFTKNFGWDRDYAPLYHSIRAGFSHKSHPVRLPTWRARSGILDRDRQLIPLRFFLFSHIANDDGADYVMPDELVSRSISQKYDAEFPKLALFAFHLARAGRWNGLREYSGRAAEWANDFIRNYAWRDGHWKLEAFSDKSLRSYISLNISGVPETRHKIFTNYRHMLRISGVLPPIIGSGIIPFSAGSWAASACKLMWDRATYVGDDIDAHSSAGRLVEFFMLSEGHKLLGAGASQAEVIALGAARQYKHDGGVHRFGL